MTPDEFKRQTHQLHMLHEAVKKAVRSVYADYPQMPGQVVLGGMTRLLADLAVALGVPKENFMECMEEGYDLAQSLGSSNHV